MTTPDQYKEISERYMEASDLLLNRIHEASGFAAYHSFESIGAAWIRRNNQTVPQGHVSKLNHFRSLSRGRRFGYAVARVAILVNSIRNKMLYPIPEPDGTFSTPKDKFTQSNIRDLNRRVKGVVNQIKALI